MNQKDFVNRTSKCFKSYFLKKRNSVKKMSCDLNFKIVFPRYIYNFSCLTLCNPMDCSPSGSSVHGIPKNTRVGCHVLLQRIFPTQGSNLHLLHWQADSLPLRHLGSKDKYKGYLKFVFPPRWNDYFSKEYFFIFLAQIIFVKGTIKQESCLFFYVLLKNSIGDSWSRMSTSLSLTETLKCPALLIWINVPLDIHIIIYASFIFHRRAFSKLLKFHFSQSTLCYGLKYCLSNL